MGKCAQRDTEALNLLFNKYIIPYFNVFHILFHTWNAAPSLLCLVFRS